MTIFSQINKSILIVSIYAGVFLAYSSLALALPKNFDVVLNKNSLFTSVQFERNSGLLPNFEDTNSQDQEELQSNVNPQLGELSKGIVDIPDVGSLLFYPAQMRLIRDFERGVLFPEPERPSEPEVREVPELKAPPPKLSEPEEKYIPPTVPSPRELKLAGITYHAPKKWTIWLNGERLTPNAIPDEIFKINVEKDFVEIIWHDKQTHKIFPVRLRPNQRFNLDARMFLPG